MASPIHATHWLRRYYDYHAREHQCLLPDRPAARMGRSRRRSPKRRCRRLTWAVVRSDDYVLWLSTIADRACEAFFSSQTEMIAASAGVIPDTLLACPMVDGLTAVSFCRVSGRRPGIRSKSKPSGMGWSIRERIWRFC